LLLLRDEFIEHDSEALQTILNIINNTTAEFKQIPSIDRTISNRYNQQLEDVEEWLSLTEWSQELIDESTITKVQDQLFSLDIISEKWPYEKLVHFSKI